MERILLLQNKHWHNELYTGLYQREILSNLIKKLAIGQIQVILGIRRSGKSTIFKLLINHLAKTINPKSILYLNLDDPFFSETWKESKLLYKVIETAEKITGEKVNYIFLDELQNVLNWEKFIKSIYDNELYKKIFITGSNSSLLKSDYATLLSGRYIIDYVYPFSLKELLNYRNIYSYMDMIKNKSLILSIIDDILKYGSFPEIIKTESVELKRNIILSYYETILLKDCIVNNHIRDARTFKELTLYLLSNISSLFSYNNLALSISSNENTIKEYISILEESFLFNEVKKYSYSFKTQIRSKKKIYCIDNSFMTEISFKFSENRGKLFENFVFNELLKMGYKDIYFYNNGKECDFIINKNNELVAIQICCEINEKNKKREIEGLLNAMDKLKISKGYIITYDDEEIINKKTNIIPFWKVFLEFYCK